MVDTVTSGAEGARKAVVRKRLKGTGWKRCPVKDRNRSETAMKHNPNTGRQAGRQAKNARKPIINHVHVVPSVLQLMAHERTNLGDPETEAIADGVERAD